MIHALLVDDERTTGAEVSIELPLAATFTLKR
jgi:hypothetical protein